MVPAELRRKLKLTAGATLSWKVEGHSLRVEKVEPAPGQGFLAALRRLGTVPAAPRDRRPVLAP